VALSHYVCVVRKRWRVVALGLLLGLLGAVAVTWLTPRQYQAQVTIYVSAQTGADGLAAAYQGSLLSEQRVKSYVRLLTGPRVAQSVVDRLQLDVPAGEVAGRIEASAQPDTVLLTVTVTDTSARRATDIADATGEVFIQLVAELERPAEDAPPTVTARIVEPAVTPTFPTIPSMPLNMTVGALVGLVTGYLLALLRDALDTTVKSIDRLTELIEVPSLGVVSRDPGMSDYPLAVLADPLSPRAEEFRKVRTNLQFVDVDQPPRTIIITSALSGEGKTSTLCNLAITLARAGRRAVVVETDLRRPRVADYLGFEGGVGVTSVLAGRVGLTEAIQPWGDATFDVLASGPIPPNPSELLASRQMVSLLAELRDSYDIVLLDTPPVLPVTDAAVLGAACDGALVVVRYGRTTTHQVNAAASALRSASVRMLGTVLTMVPKSSQDTYGHYYAPESNDGAPDPWTTPPVTAPTRRVRRVRRVDGSLPTMSDTSADSRA
jgi:capsular exopolysaccharide synthesis family protein